MPFSVITIVWLEEHAAFVVECFIKTESYMAVQLAFCEEFELKRHDSVQLLHKSHIGESSLPQSLRRWASKIILKVGKLFW